MAEEPEGVAAAAAAESAAAGFGSGGVGIFGVVFAFGTMEGLGSIIFAFGTALISSFSMEGLRDPGFMSNERKEKHELIMGLLCGEKTGK